MRTLSIRFALLAALMPLASVSAIAHPPAILSEKAQKLVAEEVAAFRKELAAAIKAKNIKKLKRMYAPTFVHTHGSGKLDGKDARIKSVLDDHPVIENAPVTELVIRIPSDWVGVATGLSPIKSEADGKTYAFRWTTVYVRESNSWNVAASHATRLHEIKP
jgi:ketosteroid isomerase-like protein